MRQYKNQHGTIFAVKEHNGAPAIMCRAELSETWSLSSMIEPFTPGPWTAEELQGQLDSWAATKGWTPVDEPASAEPPKNCFTHGSVKQCPDNAEESCLTIRCQKYIEQAHTVAPAVDDFPDWVRPMVEAFLQSPFFRELPAFTAFAIRHSEPVQHCQGGTLADGLYDTDSKGVKFYVFRGDSSDQYWEVSYTWADFVRRCKAAGLEPDLREKEKTLHPQPGDVYQDPQSGKLYKIGELTNGKKTCYLTMRSNEHGDTWVPVNSSVYPNLSDAQGEFEAWIRTKQLEPTAPTGAAAVTTGGNAASAESTAGTSTTSESGEDANNSPGLPSAPADTSPQPPKAADAVPATRTTASSASGNGSLPAFDYSGLDDQTVQDLHLAEREVSTGKRLAEMGLRRMADGVSIAHDALCVTIATKCRNGKGAFSDSEKTFGSWCESVGLNRKAAERLLQVSKLFDSSSPRQQQVLEELSPSLLYAAAKPSAPAELVQAVKSGDITTHKQYQDLLKENQQLRADRVNALNAAAAAEAARDAALADVDGLHEQNRQLHDTATNAQENADAALRRATEAELRAKEAEKQLAGARQVADAARMRADKYQREAEAAKAQPVAAAVDEDEINRRAHTLADELTAPLRSELEAAKAAAATPEQIELDTRNAYDSLLLAGRAMQNAWKSVKPQLAKLPPDTRAGAINQLTNTLTEIQTEAIKCL